jgi:hypothetical protein
MTALLTTNYIHVDNYYYSREKYEQRKQFKQWIEDNKGKEVEIDTNCIFDNQYNTVSGYHIYDTWIDSIKNDVRTNQDVFFVKHPNGKDEIKKLSFKDHLKNERFLLCSSVNGNYYRISRRSNIEFILVGDLIYITNNIGYTPIKKARLSSNEKIIVQYCVNRILTNKY